ncbi:class I adenylate-forming enzyme family protein [Neobacillus sp. 114]|uniref:class I adenylate-forming enzyme family protein n=1 Tax=Neobacillus sp. 114 TaxID=3048535 RepID=UPI0024C2E356|nr:class I adenylate-forming enzyme family protein [Neobacillus sp. 114]
MDLVGNRNLISLLNTNVKRQPSNAFITTETGDSITWKDFSIKVNQYAGTFFNQGINKGTYVVVHHRTTPDLLSIMFGLYKIGAVVVMSNIANTKDDLSYIIEYTNSKFIVFEGCSGDTEYINHIQSKFKIDKIFLHQKLNLDINDGLFEIKKYIENANIDIPLPTLKILPDDPATMIFTSGTTARPKGVIYSHGNHIFSGEIVARTLKIENNDIFMHHFPLFHMNGLGQIFAVLTAGCNLLLFERFRSSVFIERIERFRPTITHLNSTHIKMILNHIHDSRYRNDTFKSIGFSLKLSNEVCDRFEAIFGSVLIELYGLTESISIPLANPFHLNRKRQSCGIPTLGYEVKIVNEFGQEQKPFEHGEIVIRCFSKYGIMSGYYNKLEETKETIKDGWLYTGDVGFYDDEGYFYMVDRRKDIIKRAGENISAREIEEAIESHPLISEVGVIGVFDPLREEVPKAFVVRKEASLTEQQLKEYCKERLANFKVPQYIEFMDKLPKTAVGKIEKKLLRAMEERKGFKNEFK